MSPDVFMVDLGALVLVGFIVWYFRLLNRE